MNDKIKELAVQADLLIKKTNGDEFRYGNFDPKFQKFAELIVKECADKCLAMAYVAPGPHHYAAMIKEHFGVE